MEGSPWPRGQKRPLENTDSGEYAAKHIGATTLEDYSPDQEQSHNVDAHQYGTSSPFQGKNISTSHEADSSMSTKRPIPSGSSSKVDGRSNLNDEHQRHGVNEPLWKKIKVNITRQGSAPPRLELAFDSSSAQTSNTNTGTLLALDRGNKEGIQSNEIKLNTAIQQVKKEKEHVSERMERLLDDLETEVTCGLCAGVFIDPVALNPCSHVFCGSCIASWVQPSTRMAYTNPFPALNEYMRRMRDMAIARYEDGYDSSSSAESDYMVRPRRIGHHLDEGSDVEDDYAPPVNPYIRRVQGDRSSMIAGDVGESSSLEDATVRIGIHKTPKEGLKCPTCRSQPVVDAVGSCLVTSMVEMVHKHRPDLVRPANEISQAQRVYKKGDKLSFPLPALSPASDTSLTRDGLSGLPMASTSMSTGAPLSTTVTALGEVLAPLPRQRSERRSANNHWPPCYHCAPLRSNDPADRYVCPEPIVARTHRMDYGCPPGHSLCSICRELGPEALRQTCSGCGEGVCGMPTRGCKIPKLAEIERLTASSAYTQVERLSSAIQIQEYSWASYRTAFQHNYYELAIFILYCIKRNQAESSMNMDQTTIPGSNNETSSTSRQKITMVDIIKATVARNMDDGGLKGIFERANKAWPWVSPDDPERLCKFCVNVMLEASIFEWWMKEVIKPEVAAQLPLRQPDCKYGRSCAFQENPKHAQSFSHLCERLSESDFMASTQPTPLQETSVDAEVSPNPETLLRRAIIHSGPAFNLPGLTMEDLHWQNGHYSGINRAAMQNAVVLDDGYGTDGGSYHSDEEDGSREITPAFETYRERGMESKAIQTQLLEGEEATSSLRADGIRSGASDATHTTFVGRTVVDHDGEPMELEGAAPQTEEAFLAADMTENAFLNLKYANTNELADRLADTDVPSMTSSSPVFESTGFTFTRQPSFVHQQVPPTTVSASVESSNRGRELSSHESMVEDLVAPRYTFSTPVPYRESAATLVAGGRTNGMVFQPHLQPESQPNRGDSPRSSPAPEAIMT